MDIFLLQPSTTKSQASHGFHNQTKNHVNIRTLLSLALLLTLLLVPSVSSLAQKSKQSGKRAEKRQAKTPAKSRAKSARPQVHRSPLVTQKIKANRPSQLKTASLLKSKSHVKREASALTRRLESRRVRRVKETRRIETGQRAAARLRQLDESLREQVQSMIANDKVVGEDPEVRRIAVNALGNHAGTVVVMDPKTGRIYSIVNQQWAVQAGFKPCSTIKLVTGLAGLNEKVINSAVESEESPVNLTSALAHSNNPFFQHVGARVGFEKMISYSRRLGLGEKTGINMPNESNGRLPMSKSALGIHRMSSHGDNFTVTPLQLGTLVSAIANGGKLISPYVPRRPGDEARTEPIIRRQIKFERDVWQGVVPGMAGAVRYGTARRARNPMETIVGKTGTCLENGKWVGLFASYAPLKDPRLVVVVIARGSDGRNHFPVTVAGRIYRGLNNWLVNQSSAEVARASVAGDEPAAEITVNDDESVNSEEYDAVIADETATEEISSPERPTARLWTPATSDVNAVKRVLLPIRSIPSAVRPRRAAIQEQSKMN